MKRELLESIENLDTIHTEIHHLSFAIRDAFKDVEKDEKSAIKVIILSAVAAFFIIRSIAFQDEMKYFNKLAKKKVNKETVNLRKIFDKFVKEHSLRELRNIALAHNNRDKGILQNFEEIGKFVKMKKPEDYEALNIHIRNLTSIIRHAVKKGEFE